MEIIRHTIFFVLLLSAAFSCSDSKKESYAKRKDFNFKLEESAFRTLLSDNCKSYNALVWSESKGRFREPRAKNPSHLSWIELLLSTSTQLEKKFSERLAHCKSEMNEPIKEDQLIPELVLFEQGVRKEKEFEEIITKIPSFNELVRLPPKSKKDLINNFVLARAASSLKNSKAFEKQYDSVAGNISIPLEFSELLIEKNSNYSNDISVRRALAAGNLVCWELFARDGLSNALSTKKDDNQTRIDEIISQLGYYAKNPKKHFRKTSDLNPCIYVLAQNVKNQNSTDHLTTLKRVLTYSLIPIWDRVEEGGCFGSGLFLGRQAKSYKRPCSGNNLKLEDNAWIFSSLMSIQDTLQLQVPERLYRLKKLDREISPIVDDQSPGKSIANTKSGGVDVGSSTKDNLNFIELMKLGKTP